MATEDELNRLRRMTGETENIKGYTDTQIDVMLSQAGGDLNAVAAIIWGEKASDYADLVNISEAGSSRSNSDLFKHAREQADYFKGLADSTAGVGIPTSSTTRRIERP